ncbi:MAG: RNA_pol_L_2 domain-containing protein [Marine Group I thaumarchaeote]|jgi:DNA-directed RNA polymerase subunit L|nr:MAG: RNA_pol_L_2 domain-containing protein [Marine Group I thaumarchaeote]
MQAQVINSSSKEINLSIKESDVATLYIIQHELLKDSAIDFAGVIIKHPLTNECWMRVNTSKSSPLKEITKATESAIKISENLKKLFNSKIK